MSFDIECQCGQRISVERYHAGEVRQCSCGELVTVPSMRELQRAAADGIVLRCESLAPPDQNAGDDSQSVICLLPLNELWRRVQPQAFWHFAVAVQRATQEFLKERSTDVEGEIQVGCALFPRGKLLFDIQGRPKSPDQPIQDLLIERLRGLRTPPVQSAPAMMVVRAHAGICPQHAPPFAFPFSDRLQNAGQTEGPERSLDNLLMREVFGGRTSWWTRLKNWWLGEQDAPYVLPGESEFTVPYQEDESDVIARIAGVLSFPEGPMPAFEKLLTAVIENGNASDEIWLARAAIRKTQSNVREAIEDYDEFLIRNPDNLIGLVGRSEASWRDGSMQAALADLNGALDRDRESIQARYARAMLYTQLEAWEEARNDLRVAARLNPRWAEVPLMLARIAIAQEKFSLAWEQLNATLALDPHHPEAFMLRGQVCLRLPDTDHHASLSNSIENVGRAIFLEPDCAEHLICRAELRLAVDDGTSALRDAETALDLEPDCWPAFAVKGHAHRLLGNWDDSIRSCTTALEGGYETAPVLATRAYCYHQQSEFESAIDDCERALELDPDYRVTRTIRGLTRLMLGDGEGAIEDLTPEIEQSPSAFLHIQRGNAYRLAGEIERAVRDYDDAVLLEDDEAEAFLNRGLCHMDLEDWDQALADFEKGIDLAPDHVPGRFSRAMLLLSRSEYDRALVDLDFVLEHEPDQEAALLHRANLYLARKEFTAAIKDYDRLIEICPTLGSAYSGRGNAWLQLGNNSQAREDLQEAIQLEPESAEDFLLQRTVMEISVDLEKEQFTDVVRRTSEELEKLHECPPLLWLRAVAHWYAEEQVEAIDDFTALMDFEGESFAALSARGQVYAEMGEFDSALRDLDQALELAEDTEGPTTKAYALSGRALALAGVERLDEARQDLVESVRQCPENAWVHYNQGLIYHQQGNSDKASVCFRLALRSDEPRLTPRKRDRAAAYVKPE